MNGSPTTGATLLEPKFTCQVCGHRGADVSSRHGRERADSLDREFEDPIPLPSGKTLKSLRGAGDYIDLPEKRNPGSLTGKPPSGN